MWRCVPHPRMPCKSVSGFPVTTALTSAVLDRVPLTVPGPGSLAELFTTGARGVVVRGGVAREVPSGGAFSELRSERAHPGQLRSAQKSGSAKGTDLNRAASSYPSSPSSSTDEGSKSLVTVDTGSAVLATIFVHQLSGAVIYLRGPQRTSANCGELQRTSPEPLRNSRISSNPSETW